MHNLYQELHREIKKYQSNPKHKWKREMAVHVPMIGTRYNSHSNMRIMWIGRALNGEESEPAFNQNAQDFSDKMISKFTDHSRFDWLRNYNYRRSAFWRTSKLVAEALLSASSSVDDWYEDLVWANLYTVAPSKGGNPCSSLCTAQRMTCGKLLKKQIELLKPSHIVFVTDWNWFCEFNQPATDSMPLFCDIRFNNNENSVIVGRGNIGHATVVVTRRPERHFTDKFFAECVIKALTDNK
ncbi:MAG: hypothetical protein E7321_07270 [Clostridiales bacterium]|nr:hypothetical protein [Clostridiales bacterium]